MTLWPELLGAEVRYVQGRYTTRVLTMGSGEPLVLMHGQGGHLENFRHNIATFAERYRVIAFDALWHGRSEKPPLTSNIIDGLVGQVIDLFEVLRIETAFIEGQSMGGLVAATLALAHPELVSRLVLTTPMGLDAGGHPPDRQRMLTVRNAQHAALDELTPERIRSRMSGLFADPRNLDDEIIAVRRRLYSDPETNAALHQVADRYFDPDAMRASTIGPTQLRQLETPTLVYWGTANPTPVDAGRQLAECLPNSSWHCAEVGHWAQYERPDEHNRVVLEFLADA